MAMTPDEIRAKSFPSVKKGGVDADVVSAYLERVAQEMQRLQIDLEAAQREVPQAEPEAAPAPTEPATRSITVVGSHVDEVLEAAQRSADAIVRDAEDWASTHKAEADAYVRQVRNQVDELRRTTEHQAESFRSETVAYANRIREDAETAAADLRQRAEADAASQYERLTQDATERWESVKSAERELLSRINITSSDLERAREHFQQAIANHSDPAIEPGDLSLATADGDVPEPPADMPEPALPEIGELADDTVDGAHDVEVTDDSLPAVEATEADDAAEADEVDPWAADAGDAVTDDVETVETAPPPPPPAAVGDAWGSDTADGDVDEGPAPSTWGSDEEPATSWDVGEPTDAWATDDTQTDTTDAWATDDTQTESTDAWATDDTQTESTDAWATPAEGGDESLPADGGPTTDAWTVPETTSAWGSDDDSATSWESGDDNVAAAASWGSDETTTSWASDEPSGDQTWGSTDGSWAPAADADPWAAEPAQSSAGSLVTSAEVTQAEEGSSFFEASDDADPDMGDDPLAAMVREAVERVTDGEGSN